MHAIVVLSQFTALDLQTENFSQTIMWELQCALTVS